MRAAIAVSPAGLILIAAWFWLAWTPLAHAGVPCHGTVGTASWYGSESGSTTASGAHFNPDGISAASMSLPLGSRVIVRNVQNGRSVQLTINDRGPAPYLHRIIDLSRGAARAIGLTGLGRVCVERIG